MGLRVIWNNIFKLLVPALELLRNCREMCDYDCIIFLRGVQDTVEGFRLSPFENAGNHFRTCLLFTAGFRRGWMDYLNTVIKDDGLIV